VVYRMVKTYKGFFEGKTFRRPKEFQMGESGYFLNLTLQKEIVHTVKEIHTVCISGQSDK
jgi:hypothetical protein